MSVMADRRERLGGDFEVCRHERIRRGSAEYERILVRTPWLGPDDDLVDVARVAMTPICRPTDTVFVAEKLVVLLSGQAVPAATLRPGWVARLLAPRVQPHGDSLGLSIPAKMQYVVEHAGALRVVLAAAAAAATRPLGVRSVFYRLAGSLARDLDGMRPPYLDTLLPPLAPHVAVRWCERLASRLGAEVAIVDINDRGGTVRARSLHALPTTEILSVLQDNPLGHCEQATPFGLLRPL